MNTAIHYEYHDGANYKRHGVWTVKGMCSQDQAKALRDACLAEDGRHFFVPSAVGIPDLHGHPWDDDIDHPMCHITDIQMTGGPADEDRTLNDLITAFRARDWEADGAAFIFEKAA